MNTKDFTFSASSFKKYLQCGLAFRLDKVDRVPKGEPNSHHRWYGTVVHNLIYAAFADVDAEDSMKTLKLLEEPRLDYPVEILDAVWNESPVDEMSAAIIEDAGEKPVGAFMEGRIKSLGKGLDFTQEELEEGWKKQAEEMIKNGISVLNSLPDVVELERKLEWEFEGRNFIGYADVIARDENGRLEFYDFKTSWNKPGRRLQEDFQFYSYSYALKQIFDLDYFPKGYFVHLKSGDPLPFEVTPKIESDMHSMGLNTFELMELDIFPKLGPHILCFYCDFREYCFGDTTPWEN